MSHSHGPLNPSKLCCGLSICFSYMKISADQVKVDHLQEVQSSWLMWGEKSQRRQLGFAISYLFMLFWPNSPFSGKMFDTPFPSPLLQDNPLLNRCIQPARGYCHSSWITATIVYIGTNMVETSPLPKGVTPRLTRPGWCVLLAVLAVG